MGIDAMIKSLRRGLTADYERNKAALWAAYSALVEKFAESDVETRREDPESGKNSHGDVVWHPGTVTFVVGDDRINVLCDVLCCSETGHGGETRYKIRNQRVADGLDHEKVVSELDTAVAEVVVWVAKMRFINKSLEKKEVRGATTIEEARKHFGQTSTEALACTANGAEKTCCCLAEAERLFREYRP